MSCENLQMNLKSYSTTLFDLMYQPLLLKLLSGI
jgi:hypothetical protein